MKKTIFINGCHSISAKFNLQGVKTFTIPKNVPTLAILNKERINTLRDVSSAPVLRQPELLHASLPNQPTLIATAHLKVRHLRQHTLRTRKHIKPANLNSQTLQSARRQFQHLGAAPSIVIQNSCGPSQVPCNTPSRVLQREQKPCRKHNTPHSPPALLDPPTAARDGGRVEPS